MKQLFFFLLLVGFTGCNSSCNKNDSRAAVIIGDREISFAKLNDVYERALEVLEKVQDKEVNDNVKKEIRASVLKKLIDDELVVLEAEKRGLSLDRFEKMELLREHKKRFGGSKGFSIFAEANLLTHDQVLNTLIVKKLKEKLVEDEKLFKTPTKEEVKQYYEANKQRYLIPDSVRARHILLSFKGESEQDKLLQQQAQRVYEEAKKHPDKFVDLVEKYSDGPSKQSKGDLGYFTKGQMVKNFEDACFLNPVGAVVGPIETDYGYHIVKILDKRPKGVPPLKEIEAFVTKDVQMINFNQVAETIVSRLRNKYPIKIQDKSLSLSRLRDQKSEFLTDFRDI